MITVPREFWQAILDELEKEDERRRHFLERMERDLANGGRSVTEVPVWQKRGKARRS